MTSEEVPAKLEDDIQDGISVEQDEDMRRKLRGANLDDLADSVKPVELNSAQMYNVSNARDVELQANPTLVQNNGTQAPEVTTSTLTTDSDVATADPTLNTTVSALNATSSSMDTISSATNSTASNLNSPSSSSSQHALGLVTLMTFVTLVSHVFT